MDISLGERIKLLRLEKGLTQPQLASFIGVANSVISNWEKGLNIPRSDYLSKLSIIFDVTADYLLGLTDELGNPIKGQDLAPAMVPTVPKTTKVTMAAKSKGNKVKNLTIELTEEQLAAFLRKLEE